MPIISHYRCGSANNSFAYARRTPREAHLHDERRAITLALNTWADTHKHTHSLTRTNFTRRLNVFTKVYPRCERKNAYMLVCAFLKIIPRKLLGVSRACRSDRYYYYNYYLSQRHFSLRQSDECGCEQHTHTLTTTACPYIT